MRNAAGSIDPAASFLLGQSTIESARRVISEDLAISVAQPASFRHGRTIAPGSTRSRRARKEESLARLDRGIELCSA